MSGAVLLDEAKQDQMASSMQSLDSTHTMSAGPLEVCDTLPAHSNTLSTALQRQICLMESCQNLCVHVFTGAV